MKKIVLAGIGAMSLLSLSAATWRDDVHSGDFTNTVNWSSGIYPGDPSQNAGFPGSQGKGDYVISISDVDLKAKAWNANVWTGSSFLWDCADSVFRMPALDEGAHDSSPIAFYAGYSGRPATMFLSVSKADTTGSVFAFSNALFKATNTANKEFTLDLTRGYFSFAGAHGDDETVTTTFASGGNVNDGRDPGYGDGPDPMRLFKFNLSDAEAVFGVFNWYGKALTNILNVADAKVKVLGDFYFTSADYAKSGNQQTNVANLVESTLEVDGNLFVTADTSKNGIGTATVTFDDMTVDVGKALQVLGNADVIISGNGSEVTVAGAVNLASNANLRITGGARLFAASMGKPSNGQETDRPMVTISGEGTKVQLNNGDYDVGSLGSGTLNVEDGELSGINYLAIGGIAPTTPQTHVFNQTGGKVIANIAIACRNADSENISSYVNLDGGVFSAKHLYGSRSTICGYRGHAYFSADGGTYLARQNSIAMFGTMFLGGFDSAELGEKGLTVESDYEVAIVQAFSDKAGKKGQLRLTGSGLVHIATNSAQSVLVCDVANTVFDAGTREYLAKVVATNGSSVSFANTTDLTLGGLELDGGLTLTVAPALRITAGSLALGDFKLALSGTFTDGDYSFITVDGEVAQTVRDAWTTAWIESGRPVGKCVRFTSAYAEGKTVFTMTVAAASEQEAVEASGLGEISGTVAVGAIKFTDGTDVTLTGAGRLFFEDTGYSSATVASGRQEIDVPVLLTDWLTVTVPGGSSLAFNRSIVRGGVQKEGTGLLSFGADAASSLPLGFRLNGGTVTVAGDPAAEPIKVEGSVACNTPDPTNAIVLSNDANVEVGGMNVTQGSLIKRGRGSYTVLNKDSLMTCTGPRTVHGALAGGTSVPTAALEFPADGSAPTANYTAFNVVEGEVVFRGTGDGTPAKNSQHFATEEMFIGMGTTLDVQTAPGVTFDHAYAQFGSMQRYIFLGVYPQTGACLGETVHPFLNITNKSDVASHMVYIGSQCTDKTADIYPEIVVDDSRWQLNDNRLLGAGKLILSGGKSCHTMFAVRNNASFQSGTNPVEWGGEANVTVDGGSLFSGQLPESAGSFLVTKADAKGSFTVKSGSTLRATGVVLKDGVKIAAGNTVDFRFDGGFLDPVAGDFTFAALPAGCKLTALAGGLKLAVPAGGVWTLPAIVEGTGPIVACGEGTVALDGTFTNAFAGAGTFAGGTLRKATVKISVDDSGAVAGGVPTFDGAAYDGRLTIDLGRTAENPINLATIRDLTVMKYATTAPSAVNFGKLVGTGLPKAYGKFRVEDGKVILESAADSRGMVLIFR